MKRFLTAVLSFTVHVLLPATIIYPLVALHFSQLLAIGIYFLTICFSIQLTVRIFNMPVWRVRTYDIVYGKEALRYSLIMLFSGAVFTALSFVVKF